MGVTEPTVIDMFAGVGGFSLGFEQAGFDVKIAIDHHKTTIETYQKNFPDTEVKNIDLSDSSGGEILSGSDLGVEDVDVIVGGPPCQGFSVMGNQDPDDDRNNLLPKFGEYISDLSPSYFVMENVSGLLSEGVTQYLDQFIETVTSAGYEIKGPEVLNAAEYGVPQNRERVFTVGYKKGEQSPDLPRATDSTVTAWSGIKDIPSYLDEVDIVDGIYRGELGDKSPYVERINSWQPLTQRTTDGLSGMAPVDHTNKVRERFSTVEPGTHDDVSQFFRLSKDRPANTLRAGSGRDRGTHTPARPIHPEAPRCITVRESARLQSFPDWFEFHSTKYHGLRQIGNSVPPLLVKQIAEELGSCLSDRYKREIANE